MSSKTVYRGIAIPELDAAPADVRSFIESAHPVDLAAWLEQLPSEQAQEQLRALARRAKTFRYLQLDAQAELARLLQRRELAAIVTQLPSDNRVDLFNQLTPEEQQRLLRELATGDVALKDWRDLIGRELLIAMALGVTMAVVVFPVGLLRGGSEIALVVGMTMVLVVIVGSLVGMSLPFLLSRLRLDTATASGPLVTTIADAVGVLVYFSIATALLSPK